MKPPCRIKFSTNLHHICRLLLIVAAPQMVRAQELSASKPAISLLRTSASPMSADTDHSTYTANVPIALADGFQINQLVVVVKLVSDNGESSADLVDAFDATLKDQQAGRPKILSIAIEAEELPVEQRSGSYELVLLVFANGEPQPDLKLTVAIAESELPPPPDESKKAAVTLLHTSAVPMSANDDFSKFTAAVPIALAEGIDPLKLKVVPKLATHDGASPDELARAFDVSVTPQDEEGRPAGLTISATAQDLPKDLRFGDYILNLSVMADGKPRPKLSVTVRLAETTLAAPQPILIEHRYFAFWKKTTPYMLWLRTVSGPPIPDAIIEQVDSAKLGDKTTAFRLGFDPIGVIERREATTVKIKPEGPYARGTTTGRALISAPGMKPVAVDFKVDSRMYKWAIVVFAAIGVTLGWVFRTLLTLVIDTAKAKLEFQRVRNRVLEAANQNHEKEFVDKLEDLTSSLDGAEDLLFGPMELRNPPLAREKLAEIQSALNVAIVNFETKRDAQIVEIDSVYTLLAGRWSLPAAVGDQIEASKRAIDAVRALTAQGQLIDAAKELHQTRVDSLVCLNSWWTTWRDQMRRDLRLIEYPTREQSPASTAPAISLALTNLRSVLATVPPEPTATGLDDFKTYLTLVHSSINKATALASQMKWAGEQTADLVADILDDPQVNLVDDSVIEDIRSAEKQLSGVDPTSVLIDSGGPKELVDQFDKALQACANAAQKQNLTAAKLKPIKDLINVGKYAEATIELIRQLQPAAARAKSSAGASRWSGAQVHPLSVSEPGPELGHLITRVSPRLSLPPHIQISIPTTWRRIVWASALQTIFAGIGLSALAYAIYHESFTGSFTNIIAIMGWGFTLDVGIGTLSSQLKTNRS